MTTHSRPRLQHSKTASVRCARVPEPTPHAPWVIRRPARDRAPRKKPRRTPQPITEEHPALELPMPSNDPRRTPSQKPKERKDAPGRGVVVIKVY